MVSGGTNLYFIALLPDQIIQDEVMAFKQEAKARFDSGHALRSPPHITLVPPFRSPLSDFSALQASADEQGPFSVQLRDFDRFGNRVIFVNVMPEPALLTCQAQIADFCRHQYGIAFDTRPFHPHMTVAFKDLKRAVFPDAWAYFSALPYERTFSADALTLLIHTGQRWEIRHRFPFK